MITENEIVALVADDNNMSSIGDNVLSMAQRKFWAEGFKLIDRKVLTKSQLLRKLFRKMMLANSKGIGKKAFENLMRGGF
jgi:hypothetical protein